MSWIYTRMQYYTFFTLHLFLVLSDSVCKYNTKVRLNLCCLAIQQSSTPIPDFHRLITLNRYKSPKSINFCQSESWPLATTSTIHSWSVKTVEDEKIVNILLWYEYWLLFSLIILFTDLMVYHSNNLSSFMTSFSFWVILTLVIPRNVIKSVGNSLQARRAIIYSQILTILKTDAIRLFLAMSSLTSAAVTDKGVIPAKRFSLGESHCFPHYP